MKSVKQFLKDYFQVGVDLKERFKITENKNWDAITVLAELNVQFGHFSYLISSHKEYGESKREIKDLGDELADILLQLINLSYKLQLKIPEYCYNYKYIKFESIPEALLSFNTVYGQISEKVLEINEYRHYKIRYNFAKEKDFLCFNIARLLEIVFSIAENLKLNLATEFKKMVNNASMFLDNYEKMQQPQFYPIVDVHATWLVLNPVQGCPKHCKYCFLEERGLNKIKPITLTSPERAVDILLSSKFYIPDMPLCLFSQTDAFSTPNNIEYLKQLIELLMEKKVKNPIVFITKCKIPDEFIEYIDKYEKRGNKFLFFLSYSGLDKDIEIGVNKADIEDNFIRLSKLGKKIIHYWRPFIPQNSHIEDIKKTYNFVKKYCVASVAIGLKTTNNIIDNIDWLELKNSRHQAMKADNVWNKEAYDYIWNKLSENDDYPIFQTTSCALGYALNQPDRKFFYNTEICLKCNKCPSIQRDRCQKKYEHFKTPTKDDIILLINKLGKEATYSQVDIQDRTIVIKDLKLNFNEISFLTEKLGIKVIVPKKEDDYYWNTSINNASILKI